MDLDFTTKTWKEDFCFIVENKRLYVARNIIALASPVFERMFEAEKEKGVTEMELPGKKFDDVKEFLKCIYPSVIKAVTIKNAYQIVALAEEYQVVALKAKCEACFLRSISTKTHAQDLYRLIKLACLYSLDGLVSKCTTLAADKSLTDLDEAEKQTPISSAAKLVIQREIINKMEATKVKSNQMIENLNTVNNYHRADLPKNDQLNLDDYKDWSGTSIFLKLDTNENTQTYMVGICGTQITVEFKVSNGLLHVSLYCPYINMERSVLEIVGKVVVVNGITEKRSFSKKITTELYYKYLKTFPIMKEGILRNGAEGYTYHGKTDVEVHLFALKTPIQKQT